MKNTAHTSPASRAPATIDELAYELANADSLQPGEIPELEAVGEDSRYEYLELLQDIIDAEHLHQEVRDKAIKNARLTLQIIGKTQDLEEEWTEIAVQNELRLRRYLPQVIARLIGSMLTKQPVPPFQVVSFTKLNRLAGEIYSTRRSEPGGHAIEYFISINDPHELLTQACERLPAKFRRKVILDVVWDNGEVKLIISKKTSRLRNLFRRKQQA